MLCVVYRCTCSLLSCYLAISCSILCVYVYVHVHTQVDHYVLPRVIVYSVERLGRGCTFTRSCNRRQSHTTASTCLILAIHLCWNEESQLASKADWLWNQLNINMARWLACMYIYICYMCMQTSSIAQLHLYETRLRKSTKKPKRSHHSTRPMSSVYNGVMSCCRIGRWHWIVLYYNIHNSYTRTSCQPVLQLIGVARRKWKLWDRCSLFTVYIGSTYCSILSIVCVVRVACSSQMFATVRMYVCARVLGRNKNVNMTPVVQKLPGWSCQ